MIKHTNSLRLFERGRRVIPNGVSSPMRAFALVEGDPICCKSANGSQVTDVDGNTYTDFLNAFGALILGHAHEEVVEAIRRQAGLGTVYGLTVEAEYELAEKIVASTKALDQIRFVCSGTEAVMTAVRIARCHTKRDVILKFIGSYHGHSDALLASPVNLDAGVAKKGVTEGIPKQLNRDVILCEYNDVEQLKGIFARFGEQIAAVLVEPFATNMGFVRPQPGFLETIRSLCTEKGAVFIFDEVVTAFRFRFGGVCDLLGIEPDLMTFGKIIGGGAAIGAYGGKADLMRHVALGGRVFQSGTFAANPLTMAAGNAAMDVLARPGFYEDLELKGALLERSIVENFERRGIPYRFTRQGALAGVAFRDSSDPMTGYANVATQQYQVHRVVHRRMLERGILMAPSLEEPIFITAAHSERELVNLGETLADVVAETLADVQQRDTDVQSSAAQ